MHKNSKIILIGLGLGLAIYLVYKKDKKSGQQSISPSPNSKSNYLNKALLAGGTGIGAATLIGSAAIIAKKIKEPPYCERRVTVL